MAAPTNAMAGPSTSEAQNTIGILDRINANSFSDEGERIQAVFAAYALVSRLETPWEFVARLCMGQPALGGALKVGKDLQLFDKWHDLGDAEMTCNELADVVSCDSALLFRLLRHLTANHVLRETSTGVFKPTALSISFTKPAFGEWINHLYDATVPCFFKMPEFLARNGYKNPVNPDDGIFQYAKGWKGDMFNYYESHPIESASFNHVMGGVMENQAGWLDIFPHQILLDTANPQSPLVVDVGGNIGHDIERFREAHPEVAHRLYLEDRPEVVARSKCPDTVNHVAYDFFTPQPIKGSRAYYMHGVLHDWSEEPARKILEMQKEAMTPGYSTLLIHDHVSLEAGANPQTTAYDLTMMVMVAGVERRKSDWEALLKSAGYKIIKIWRSPKAVQSVIEAELDI